MLRLKRCRGCWAPQPYLFLPMGEHVPASMLVRRAELGEMQPHFRLDVHACLQCGLVGVPDRLPADFFRRHLRARTSSECPGEIAQLSARIAELAAGGWLCQINAGEGRVLAACRARGVDVGGTEADQARAMVARHAGLDISIGAFDADMARTLRSRRGLAQVVLVRNELDREGDLHGFLTAVGALLDPRGSLIVDTRWSCAALRLNAFDCVSAEHLSLFSLHSLVRLCAMCGLVVVDAETVGAQQDAIRIVARPHGNAAPGKSVAALLRQEVQLGLLKAETYDAFADRAVRVRDRLLSMLWDFKAQGLHVAGYGVSENGNTLLNFCGIGRFELDFLADADPAKHELYSPGMKIPIRPIEAIRADHMDVLILLDDELMRAGEEELRALSSHASRLLVPLPEPRVLN